MDSYGLRRQFEELLVAAPAPTFSAKNGRRRRRRRRPMGSLAETSLDLRFLNGNMGK